MYQLFLIYSVLILKSVDCIFRIYSNGYRMGLRSTRLKQKLEQFLPMFEIVYNLLHLMYISSCSHIPLMSIICV